MEDTQIMDDDVLPIAQEILAGLQRLKEKVEHSKSQYLTSIPIVQEKSAGKSPNIAQAFAAARNAKKCKGTSGIT